MRGSTLERWLGHLRPLSVALGWLLFGQRTTLCAIAWRNCATHPVAWWWVRTFGVVHCSQSEDWDSDMDGVVAMIWGFAVLMLLLMVFD